MAWDSNKVVTINYTVKDDEGTIVDETTKDQPFSFISGQNQILPTLEENISKMLIGSTQKVVLKPNEAYGDFNEDAVRLVKRTDFPEEMKIEEGQRLMADTGEGKHLPFIIKEIKDNDITIDFNHPLAGKTLEFNVELIDIRDATDEELMHGHSHGPGGHQH
jgi:FKBP-type peptidyl-prolyl cis-trans isomerase SlyD